MEDGEDRLGNVPGPCLGGRGKGGLLLAWPALGEASPELEAGRDALPGGTGTLRF